MRRPFLFFVALILSGASVSRRGRFRDTSAQICAHVHKQFYKRSPELDRWFERCQVFARANAQPPNVPTYLDRVQTILDDLRVSHLRVYDPRESAELRAGQAVNTGIHSRYVDGHLIIYRVVRRSPADRAGLRPGDEIVSLPGIEEVSPYGATFRIGTYHLVRRGRPFRAKMTIGLAVEYGDPMVTPGPNGARVVTVPSFELPYVTRERVRKVARAVAGAPRVIVDIRENGGGDVRGMLRPLAIFLGEGAGVGSLRRGTGEGPPVTMAEQYDRPGQQDAYLAAREIRLETPPGYPRYDGPVTVLTAERTGSASEIFAAAMAIRPNTRVWGWPTAGQVVVAGYHELPSLGFGYMLSVPVAAYYTEDGTDLEGMGVNPSRTLYYDLAASLRGEDSWITEASR